MKKYLILGCVVLAGCVSTSRPVPIGKNSYYINATGGAVVPIAQMTTSALEDANDFCTKQGMKMMVDHTQGGYRSSEIFFLCVPEEQYNEVHTRSEPNVRIQNSN